jgi:hypothetical protein
MKYKLQTIGTIFGVGRGTDRFFLPPVSSRQARFITALIVITLLTASLGVAPANAQCNGNTNARVYFEPGSLITDIVGLRYKFNVAINNQSLLHLKIHFAAMRFYKPGAAQTYLLESNLYARGLSYTDQVCTTWPLVGTLIGSEASLRVAVPDYIDEGMTGAKTFASGMFPRQSYKIDGGPIDKTDMISQINLNGITAEVEISRGNLVTDKTGWKCSGDLDASTTYQQWDATVRIGAIQYKLAFALPAASATYFAPWEVLNYFTEFFAEPGAFQVFVWDHEIMREATNAWQPVEQWIVDRHCGDLNQYGVRVDTFAGNPAIEISNVGADDYFAAGSVFSLGGFRDIAIDFKPGNAKNAVNPRAKGGIWVAVLSDTDSESPFDPSSQVDIPTIEFGPGGAKAKRYKVKDINKDELGDLLLRFNIPETGIACGDTEATLTGETFDGVSFTGTDSIKTVGCKPKPCHKKKHHKKHHADDCDDDEKHHGEHKEKERNDDDHKKR